MGRTALIFELHAQRLCPFPSPRVHDVAPKSTDEHRRAQTSGWGLVWQARARVVCTNGVTASNRIRLEEEVACGACWRKTVPI